MHGRDDSRGVDELLSPVWMPKPAARDGLAVT